MMIPRKLKDSAVVTVKCAVPNYGFNASVDTARGGSTGVALELSQNKI